MASKKSTSLSQEEIISTFQKLRTEQQLIIGKITEVEGDKNEHRIVLDTLKGVDPGRKCFRMVGGVLVERTVKEVIPALEHNYEQMSTLIPKLMEEVTKKGQELVTFKQKHGIKLLDERDSQAVAMGAGGTKSGGSESMAAAPTTAVAGKGSSVLVSK